MPPTSLGQLHVSTPQRYAQCLVGPTPFVSRTCCTDRYAPARGRWAGQRRRAHTRAASASEWNYGTYSSGGDWSMTPGAYSDPRAPGPGARRRPAAPPPERAPSDGPSTSYDGGQNAQVGLCLRGRGGRGQACASRVAKLTRPVTQTQKDQALSRQSAVLGSALWF
jgi:hypothetical protein